MNDPAEATARIIHEIAGERLRQRIEEGWTPEHDDAHADGELSDAAACYAWYSSPFNHKPTHMRPNMWPWDIEWWKPTDRRRDLVKAAALIVAEVERLDRIGEGAA